MMKTKKIFSTLAAALLLALPHQASAAIDPATAQKLSVENAFAFGHPVVLSADGSTALIGSYGDGSNGAAGAAYVFTLKNGTWTQQAKLIAADADDQTQSEPDGSTRIKDATTNNQHMGMVMGGYMQSEPDGSTKIKDATTSNQGMGMGGFMNSFSSMPDLPDGFSSTLALSANGSTALIGSAFDPSVHVFTRAADGSWTQQAKLPETGSSSIALSADGGTALIGNASKDEANVFTRAADGSWTQQAKLTAAYAARFGISVSLSADGGKALVGAVGLDNHTGSAYVFTRAADGKWATESAQKLTASDCMIKDMFGFTVSLSGDGGTALIGAYDTDKKAGAVYVFRNQDTVIGWYWFQKDKLIVPNIAFIAFVGYGTPIGHSNPLSLSADGRTALIGAAGNEDGIKGSARIFLSTSDDKWTQQTDQTSANSVAGDHFGRSVSLSADGNTALISGSRGGDDGKGGTAYVFTGSAKPSTETTPRP